MQRDEGPACRAMMMMMMIIFIIGFIGSRVAGWDCLDGVLDFFRML